MILVTGASGHFGKAAIQFLLDKGVEAVGIAALVRNEESGHEFAQRGVNVVVGDYDQYDSLVNAFQGVDQLLFVSSSDVGNRLAQHRNAVEAAKAAGVKHIVYTSMQRKNETPSSPLWVIAESHLQTEKWIQESGMSYTFLRNNLYMDFVPGFIGENVLQSGVIFVPAQDGKVSAVLRSEMAEAAAVVLSTGGHGGKQYNFSNEAAVSYRDMAQAISQVSGKEIKYISPTADEYSATLASYGVPAEGIGIFTAFAVAQDQGELDVVSSDLEFLLGRKPLSVLEFLNGLYAKKD
jgi:NAD(P)H dehydrogenase (quinone)